MIILEKITWIEKTFQLHPDFLLLGGFVPFNLDKVEFAVTTRKEPIRNFVVSFAVTQLESLKYDFPTIVSQRYWKATARISRWMEKTDG